MAALLGAQHVARAADLQIAHGDAVARAELRKLPDGREPLVRRFGEQLASAHGQVGVGLPAAAPHAPADLIQLGEAEAVRVKDDQRVGLRHVQPAFHDRGAKQHVIRPGVEVQHHVLQRVFAHLSVGDADARLGHELVQPVVHLLDAAHAVIEEVHLPAARQLAPDGLADHVIVVFHHVGLDGQAFLRRRFQNAHVADARHAHVQRARDGRGREGEHVHAGFHVLDALLVADAEAVLLVHDEQPQVLELHVLVEQAVRAHHQVQFALAQLAGDLALLPGRAEAAEHVKLHGEAREALFDGVVMLLHQNRGRGQDGYLLALHHGLEGRAQGHLGLAVAHVAAEQAVHVARAFHVGLDLRHALLLVLGQLVGEHVLELLLPRVVVAEGVAGFPGAFGIELGKVEGQLLEARLDLGFLPFPFLAAQTVELGGSVFGADELGDAVELVGGHVELVVARILNEQIVALGPVVLQLHHAPEQADAVQIMHHVVAGLEVGEGGDALARGLLLAGALVGGAVDIGVADDAQPRRQVHKPLGIGHGQEQYLPRDEVAVQRGAVGRGHVLRGQRGLQPAAARFAAGEQHHAGAFLLPFGDVLAQRLQPALVGHGGPGTEGDGLPRRKAAEGAHRVAQAYGGPRLEVLQQVLIGEAQVLLRVEGVPAQPRVLIRLRKGVRRGAQAGLILVRPVQKDDGVFQIPGRRHRIVQQHVHPHGRGADHLPGAHAVHVVEMTLPGGPRLRPRLAGATGGLRAALRLGEQVLGSLQGVQPA